MVGYLELTAVELEQYGLGIVHRGSKVSPAVTFLYCLRCGTQVCPERREADPNGWWECARKCNTLYAQASKGSPPRIAP
jgi:hypothetical protein